MAEPVEITGLKHALREINTFDRTVIPRLRNRLRTATAEDRAKVDRVIKEVTPMLQATRQIGMFHNGRSAWNEATVDVDRVTGRQGAILAIKATGRGRKFGYDYAELAGIRVPRRGHMSRNFKRAGSDRTITTRQNGQGEGFAAMLDKNLPAGHTAGVGGRYAFQGLVRRMPYITKKVFKIIMDFADETSYNINTKDN